MKPTVRPMVPADVDEVLALENAANLHPWNRVQLEEEFQQAASLMHVAVQEDGRIAGYVCTWLVLDEVHVQNIATHPSVRRQGVGRLLLTHGVASRQGKVALLEVRAGNVAARGLYSGLGFVEVGLRRRYYAPNGEDAVLMQATLVDGRLVAV